MKKFLQYQIELVGTNENDLTEEFCNKLNDDYSKGCGIYNPIYGETIEVAAHVKNNTIVLCGCIIADTIKECKSLYGTLKIEAKRIFPKCTKTSDLLIATGNKLI